MKDTELETRMERIEEIIELLEDGDIPLDEAKSLREEAYRLLEETEEQLEVGDGDVSVLSEG